MKHSSYLLLILFIFTSCSDLEKTTPQNELFSEDYIKFQSENKIGIVDLDSVTNFSELRTLMGKLTCKGKISGLRFELNNTRYHITGFSNCATSGEVACYFNRNTLSIRNDSLILGHGKYQEKKNISYLEAELKSIMENPYNFQHNENKVNPAIIHLFIEDKYPISTTKKVLKEIAQQFSAINSKNGFDYFKYNILFEAFDITNIPPPPPAPK